MNKNFSNIVLSLSAILALSACGTNDDYRVSDNSKVGDNKKNTEQKGLSGFVLSNKALENSIVCFDTNKNGICDKTEDFTTTNKEGKFSFTKAIKDKNKEALLLAQIKDNSRDNISIKYILSAKQVSTNEQNITPYTTLVVNEDRYNLRVKQGKITSNKYLSSKFSDLNDELLNGSDYLSNSNAVKNANDLIQAYKQAYELSSNEPFLGIATVVDEIIKNKKYNVNINSIDSQEIKTSGVEEDKFTLSKLSNQKFSWEKSDEDQVTLGSTYSKDKFINYSKWHNRLIVLDTSKKDTAPTLIENKKYLNVNGSRHTVDSKTGASEQPLKKVLISNDSKTIYSLVNKYEDSSSNKGVGIYKLGFNTATSGVEFASVTSQDSFFADSELTDITLSSDGNKLFASSNDKKIYLFNSGLANPQVISTSKKSRSLTLSNDGKYLFTGLYARKNNSFAIYDIQTKSLLGEYKLDYTPVKIVQSYDNTVFVSNENENKVYQLDISNKANITLKNTFSTVNNIKNITLSKDYLVVSTENKKVSVFDISDNKRKVTINLDSIVNNAYELTSKKIAVNTDYTLQYYSLTDVKASIGDNIVITWEQTHRGEK